MKRILLAAFAAALLSSTVASHAQVHKSICSGTVTPAGSQSCTFVLAGPVTGTATSQPGPDGIATVRLVVTADPRGVGGSRILGEPIVLAECQATNIGAPATCSVEFNAELRTPAPTLLTNSDGSSLPGRCTATGSGTGEFSCLGGSV